jgi:hypothetical protein|tara:strand:- start:8945 stop:9136 length:192 start_codon:yes stop_codon:yes gene_type:complete
MNFTDAVRKSMQKFLDGDLSLKELEGVNEEEMVYTTDFFDELEEQMLEDDEPTGKKKDDKDED